MRPFLLPLALCLLVLAALPASAATFFVEARPNNTFSPSTLTIEQGDTVTFSNAGGTHNVVANDASFRCANGCDGAGGNGNPSNAAWTFSLTFDEIGTIGYFCAVHQGVGMTGQIIVEEAGAPPMPGALRFSAVSVNVNEGSGTALLLVERSGGDDGAVGINYVTSNGTAGAGSDYTGRTGSLSWGDQDSTPKAFTVSILEDTISEPTETFSVALSNPTGGATLGSPSTATVQITDNDTAPTDAGELEFDSTEITANEGDGSSAISVVRSSGTDGAVSVTYDTSDGTAVAGSDYQSISGTLSWANGEGGAKSFAIPLIDDADAEPAETVDLSLSNPTGGAALGSSSSATLTILDDDVDTGPCVPDETTLCLGADDRFRVQVVFEDFEGNTGDGQVVDIGRRDSGLVYFFNENNIEMLVKVLNACGTSFNSYWVFYAATTNIEFTLTVVDTEAGETKQYFNPLRNPAAPVQDTRAFATCP